MSNEDELALWAKQFLNSYGTSGEIVRDEPPLTDAAIELLASVDAGGVPMFISTALANIAHDHGIALTPASTPNEIIEALKLRR